MHLDGSARRWCPSGFEPAPYGKEVLYTTVTSEGSPLKEPLSLAALKEPIPISALQEALPLSALKEPIPVSAVQYPSKYKMSSNIFASCELYI